MSEDSTLTLPKDFVQKLDELKDCLCVDETIEVVQECFKYMFMLKSIEDEGYQLFYLNKDSKKDKTPHKVSFFNQEVNQLLKERSKNQ